MVDAAISPRGAKVFFDRGIDSIVGTPDAPELLYLPAAQDLAPASAARATALDELLGAANLESLLEAASRPDVAGRELLSPHRFRAAMERVAAHLQSTADARRYANPRVARLLDSAGSLLAEEGELRELLAFYRNALLQG